MLTASVRPLLEAFRSPPASAEDEAAFDAHLLSRVALYACTAAVIFNLLHGFASRLEARSWLGPTRRSRARGRRGRSRTGGARDLSLSFAPAQGAAVPAQDRVVPAQDRVVPDDLPAVRGRRSRIGVGSRVPAEDPAFRSTEPQTGAGFAGTLYGPPAVRMCVVKCNSVSVLTLPLS